MLWNNGLSSGFTPYQTFIVPPKNLIKKTCKTSRLLNGYCGIQIRPQTNSDGLFFLTLSFFYGSTYVHLYSMTYTAAGYTYTYCTFTNCTDTVHTREDTVCISQMDRLQIKIINHSHFFTPSKLNSKFSRYTVTRNIEEN